MYNACDTLRNLPEMLMDQLNGRSAAPAFLFFACICP
jgi:hypothetical protein